MKNEWTLDKMISLAEGVYTDSGDGVLDKTDKFGFTVSSCSNAYDTAFYSC